MIEVVSGFKFTDSTEPLDGRNNFLTIADMKECEICDEGHITFCKATGKTYRFVSKNTDGTSKTKDSTYGYWEEFENSKIPLKSDSTHPTSIKTVGKEDTNEIKGDEVIVLGTNTVGNKDRSFGWGSGYQGLWLTGSNSTYTVRLGNTSDITGYTAVLEAMATTCVNTYVLSSGSVHTKVTKITSATFANNVLTITTEDDLGTLNDEKYCYQNITGWGNFCIGNFQNSGKQNIAIGTGCFSTGDFSINIGKQNGNLSNNSVIVGDHNTNKSNRSSIIGNDNSIDSSLYSGVFGEYNRINAYNETNPSYVIGYDNVINQNVSGEILGKHNTLSYNGIVVGDYNKEYVSNDDSVKNFFTISKGTADNARINYFEQKNNGDVYIKGIGNFTGNNSDVNTTKSLQGEINDLQTQNVVTSTALNNLNEKVEEQEKVTSSGLNDLEDELNQIKSDIANFGNSNFSGDYDDLINKPSLATVATSGLFNDLTNNPFDVTNSQYDKQLKLNGIWKVSFGYQNQLNGNNTNTFGNYLTLNYPGTVVGQYNHPTNYVYFTVGTGSNNSSRKNGFVVDTAGNIYAYGINDYDGTNAINPETGQYSLTKFVNNLDTRLGTLESANGPVLIKESGSNGYIINQSSCHAFGGYSIALGYQTVAKGSNSLSEGSYVIAYGNDSHAEGTSLTGTAKTVSDYSGGLTININYKCKAGYVLSYNNQFAVVTNCNLDSNGNFIIGLDYPFSQSIPSGTRIKIYTGSIGNSSHSEGYNSVASGSGSHAEGGYTTASGINSHAEGEDTIASGGAGSHAEGYDTSALGDYGSHAEGNGTTASGEASHAEGEHTQANGNASHSEGAYTIANHYCEHASGMYNVSTDEVTGGHGYTLYSIGIGSYVDDRSNAFEVLSDGLIYMKDVGNYNGTNAGQSGVLSLQDEVSKLERRTATSLTNNTVEGGKKYNIHLTSSANTLRISTIENSTYESIIYLQIDDNANSKIILPITYKSVGVPSFEDGKDYVISILDGIIVCGEINEISQTI